MMKNTDQHELAEAPGKNASLTVLLERVQYTVVRDDGKSLDETSITGVTDDSRAVEQGYVFVAVAGLHVDGHRYIEDAIEKGCVAVIVQSGCQYEVSSQWGGWIFEVTDSRMAYGIMAGNYYGNPADSMTMIGITGTNGKTTITYLLEEILEELDHRVGVIGTVNYRYHDGNRKIVMPSPFTTPEPMQLQALLFEMQRGGVKYLVMEVSSHALAQQRIGNLLYDVVAFTNLSHDHLDYHHSMDEYFQAKKILFTDHIKPGGKAVISTPLQPADDKDWSGKLVELCNTIQVSWLECGPQQGAGVRVLQYNSTLKQTEFKINVEGEILDMTTPLAGHFNVDNLVTTITLARALDLSINDSIPVVARTHGAPGRLERVTENDSTEYGCPVVFVDYAHTPDALKQVLATVAALPHGELFCVFGCGGDRDADKRPLMGGIAAGFADVVIVTDDNPRTENPDSIRAQIVEGVVETGLQHQDNNWLKTRSASERGFVVIPQRRDAITETIRSATPEDIVVIAGKGHEKYQLTIAGKRFFDDCLEARNGLLSWHLDSVIKAIGATAVAGSSSNFFGKVSTDTRTIQAGDIFVALRGERFDGHDFLQKAADAGAGCLVVEKENHKIQPGSTPVVMVKDTLQALADMAAYRRSLMAAKQKQIVVGITGSCGKTTVKEMTAAILRRKWPEGPDHPSNAILATKGNLNNLIGMPLSLLPIDLGTRAAVLEMGMNVPGEIRRMGQAATPDICCITNVHGVHLEGLHSIEGVAAAKEELFAEAGENTTLIINLDDPHISSMSARYQQKKITFTTKDNGDVAAADLYVSDVELTGGMITFVLHARDESEEIHLYTVGLHNVANSVAAAAIGLAAGATLEEIAAGLADFRPADRRMVITESAEGLGIINDTYNANPASMAAGIATLKQMGGSHSAAMLGDMLELGEEAREAHRELGRLAGVNELDFLGVVGEFRQEVVLGALEEGMNPERVRMFDTKEDAARYLLKLQSSGQLTKDDWLLVKASRGLQMETIVEQLTGKG